MSSRRTKRPQDWSNRDADRPYRSKPVAEIARNMSAIRSKENRTERALRQALHALGLRFRKYTGHLPGRPDIVFPRERVAVFVDGDYWHARLLREKGLRTARDELRTPNRDYWLLKFQRRIERDDSVTRELLSLGWEVLRFWESDVKRDVKTTACRVASTVKSRRARLSKL